MVLRSYAKLNLYLKILNKRQDNYHNIETIFERINLFDTVVLTRRTDKKINLVCRASGIPTDPSKNIAYRSAKLLQDKFNLDYGADIRIIKRIPVACGLAGGSSNAAVVLMGLNKLWNLNLSRRKVLYFAKAIGADVPFFIYDCPFAYARGKGDQIRPLKYLNKLKIWHILVVPPKKVITAKVYKAWDSLRIKLTRAKSDVKILLLALRKKDPVLLAKALFNSLEQASTKLYPEVGRLKKKLNLGSELVLMSGSGPAMFGIISSKKQGLALRRQLKAGRVKKRKSWQIFVTETH